jgi:hypothetical protein
VPHQVFNNRLRQSEVVAVTTIAQAAATNDRRGTLVALRDKLAATIDTCESGRDVAALSRRLMDVMAELDALPDPSAAKSPVQAARARARSRGRPA